MAAHVFHSRLVELAMNRQHYRLVARRIHVRHAQNERLVALVGATVKQVRRLGVRARHDDARHAHHVELEACRIQPLDLLIL